MNIEQRFSVGECHVEERAEGAPVITGYGAVYYDGTPGTQYSLGRDRWERMMPGAFERAAREDDVVATFNHDPSAVLGRSSAGTLRMSADQRGLRYEIDPPDTQVARDLMTSIKRGDVPGSSFGFVVTDERWVKEGGLNIRQVHGVKMVDVGPVTNPAYKATSAGVRAEGDTGEADASYERWQERLRAEQQARQRRFAMIEKGLA